MTNGRLSVDAGRLHVDGNGRIYYNDAPVADISSSDTSPTEGDGITLYDQATDPNDDLESWDWDFDDGDTATGSGDKSHTYSSSGTYNPSLTVADVFGVSDTAQVEIDVQTGTEIIDDFEDGDVSDWSGDSAQMSASQTDPLNGSWSALHSVDTGDGTSETFEVVSSDLSISAGTEFGCWFSYSIDSIGSGFSTTGCGLIAYAQSVGTEPNGYYIIYDFAGSTLEVGMDGLGSSLGSSSISLSTDTYYRFGVQPQSGGFDAVIFDQDGSELGRIEVSDQTYTSGNVGVLQSYSTGPGSAGIADTYIDDVYTGGY